MPFPWQRRKPPPLSPTSTLDSSQTRPHRPSTSHSNTGSTSTRVQSQVIETSDEEYRVLANSAKRPPSPASTNVTNVTNVGRNRFEVVDLPVPEQDPSNCLLVTPSDFPAGIHVVVNDNFPLTVKHDKSGSLTQGQVGISVVQRQWMSLSGTIGDTVTVSSIDESCDEFSLVSMDLDIDFSQDGLNLPEIFFVDEMAKQFIQSFNNQFFCLDQRLLFRFHNYSFKAVVKRLNIIPAKDEQQTAQVPPSSDEGILVEKTKLAFIGAPNSHIKIKPTASIIAPTFKFEDLGIGGLDTEFATIFRRAFASRIFPRELVTKLEIQHIKGIILFGPPGTGKTLMARRIGQVLNAREPKIVNGPEVLDKRVGESEANIRNLFVDAEQEYKEKKEKSGLHIVILDEIDAICKRRGGDAGSAGLVGDRVVNQLLSKMDGVDQMNNILLIGMTNRLDMIDEALLRPGRFEVCIGFPMPDEQGRRQILSIHTSKMRKTGYMDTDVNLAGLATQTNSFSGADISGLVRCATSFALCRHVKLGAKVDVSPDISNLRVNMNDFVQALDEVRPALGASLAELEEAVPHGIIHFDDNIKTLLYDGSLFVQQVRNSGGQSPLSILLHGPRGSGKTALAVTIAKESQFPFIKLVSPDNMVGFSEMQKVVAINKVFADSYKSPLSVIVIDNIERLVEWVPLGPSYRFSSVVLRNLYVLLQRQPPTGHRLLIICTTSVKPMLTELQMSDIFDADFQVPPITSLRSLERVLHAVELFWRDKGEQRLAISLMQKNGFAHDRDTGHGTESRRLHIGIKRLLRIIEMASQERRNIAERLIGALVEHMSGSTVAYL